MEQKKENKLTVIEGLTLWVQQEFKDSGVEYTEQQIKQLLSAMELKGILTPNLIKNPKAIVYFLRMCIQLKLNPLMNEIYAIPFGNSLQIIIDYKQYILRAKQCEGWNNFENTCVDRWRDNEGREHLFPLNECYHIVKCRRKGDEFIHTSIYYMNEWKKDTPQWNKSPKYMLEKTAIKNTLAHIYPEALAQFVNVDQENQIEGFIIDPEEHKKEQEQEQLLDIKKVIEE